MAFTWLSFAESSKDASIGETYPPAVRLSADTFVAFSGGSEYDAKRIEYSAATASLSKSTLYSSSPPWGSIFPVYGASICTLSDGRVLAAGGDLYGVGYHRGAYLGTYTGSAFTWVATTDLPVDGDRLYLLLLSDNRVLLIRTGGAYAPYFGTVSGNTITWVLGTGNVTMYLPDDSCVLLADGRVLVGGGSSHSVYTISGTSVSSGAITDSGSPLSHTYPHETLIESGAAIFSCMRGPDARRAEISGSTLTHAALPSMGESTSNEMAVFEGSDGAYIVLFFQDSTEPLGLVGVDPPFVIVSASFSIGSGATAEFSGKEIHARAWESTQGADFYSPLFATDDRNFSISSGTDVYFDAWGTFNISSGSETSFVSADVHSVRFAIVSGSDVAIHPAAIRTNIVRIQGRTKVDFIPSFEKQTAFKLSSGTLPEFAAVFQIPVTFDIRAATSLAMRWERHSQPIASISCGSVFVPHLSAISPRSLDIASSSDAIWVSDASNLTRLSISCGSECEFVSAARYVDRQEFPAFAGCH